MNEEPEFWYRYVDQRYAGLCDPETGRVGHGSVEIHLERYRVLKHTPKGVWLIRDFGRFEGGEKRFVLEGGEKRFVLKGSHRRFACPTLEEAQTSFRARKKAQLRIYNARVRNVQEALAEFEYKLHRERNAA